MTMVSSRVALVHRATVERDATTTTDSWGQPASPDWQTHLADLPCYAWIDAGPASGREPVNPDRTIAVIDRRMIVALGTDVTEKDRIASATYRGAEIFEGPMGIEAVLPHEDHIEILLERIR